LDFLPTWNSFCRHGYVSLLSAVSTLRAFSSGHADKVSPPKFDILEFFFYKKKNLYQKTYLNFRIINDENLSEIYPYFSQTAFLCIHNCNSLRKGVERSLASHVELKDQKRVKEWKLRTNYA